MKLNNESPYGEKSHLSRHDKEKLLSIAERWAYDCWWNGYNGSDDDCIPISGNYDDFVKMLDQLEKERIEMRKVAESTTENPIEREFVNRNTLRNNTMKKLNITKEQFNRSRYFQEKYGTLEYVSESGKIYKTSKGKLLKFNEGFDHILYNTLLKRKLQEMGLDNEDFYEQCREDYDTLGDIVGKLIDGAKLDRTEELFLVTWLTIDLNNNN